MGIGFLLMFGGVVMLVLGALCSRKYMHLVEEGTGAGSKLVKGRISPIRKPDYKKIELFKKLQLLCYGGGFVMILYGIMKASEYLNFW